MADVLEERAKLLRAVRWWESTPSRVRALEGSSLREDRTIRRLRSDEIDRLRDLRDVARKYQVEPADLLVYLAPAEGPFGRYRLAAVFPLPPEVQEPAVLCLDGPRGAAASQHRNGEVELCLYYTRDPDERRWKAKDGLLRLIDLARRHVVGEYIYRTKGAWPIKEAPHGDTEPAPPDPSLALPLLKPPGRNEPCRCGSGRKSKRCCWR